MSGFKLNDNKEDKERGEDPVEERSVKKNISLFCKIAK